MSSNLLENCICNFIDDRKLRGLAQSTLKFYQDELNYFNKWILKNYGEMNIEDINSKILKSYFLFKSQSRNKGGVYASFRSVRAMFRFTEMDMEWTFKNPIKKIRLPNPKPDILEEIPLSDVQKILDVCGNDRESLSNTFAN